MKLVEDRNSRNLGYTLEENQFADQTLEELDAKYAGGKDYTANFLENLGADHWEPKCKDDNCNPLPEELDW